MAPPVESLMDTVCAVEYVPPAGLNVGVATVATVLIVYVAEATEELVSPLKAARALIVTVPLFTAIALLYTVDEVVGVEPSVV